MKTKIFFILTLFFTLLNATTVDTVKEIYAPQESIIATVSGMQGDVEDWVGVYPIGSNNDWENVVKWNWTGGIIDGNVTIDGVPLGDYEVRAFFANSFDLEANSTFSVDGNGSETTITTDKDIYLPNEEINVTFANLSGDNEDWIGIYPAGSSNDWGNVITYHFSNGIISDSEIWQPLPVGNYEIRVFFQNSFNLEASHAFSVEDDALPNDVTLTLNKESYAQNELIYINYDNMQGNASDWIGIYPAGASYLFENVIDWKATNGNISGEISLGGFPANTQLHGSTPMPGLAPGNYEIRAFFNNTLHQEQMVSFTVVDTPVVSTIYEDANGSISPDWVHVSGPYLQTYYEGVVRLKARWINNHTNTSEYILPFDVPNTTQKVLELDVGGAGRWTPHFNVGVLVQTTNGQRRMLWDSFLNHYNVSANKQGTVLSFPTYVELQRSTANSQKHFRVNADKYLKILEPDNSVLSITAFFATGGDLDNIKLSSH